MARIKNEGREENTVLPAVEPATLDEDLAKALKEAAVAKKALNATTTDWETAYDAYERAQVAAVVNNSVRIDKFESARYPRSLKTDFLLDFEEKLSKALKARADKEKLGAVESEQKKRKLDARVAFDEANNKVKRICATIIDKS